VKRECRYSDGFGGGCVSVDSGGSSPAIITVDAAVVASFAAAAFIFLKVLWRLVLRSQVGWGVGVDDVVLALFADLLSSRGCIT